MKKLLTVCFALLSVIVAKATVESPEAGKYYFFAYDKTKSQPIYIELTQSSDDSGIYYATGETLNSSTDLTSIEVIYGNWATKYSVESAITRGTAVTLSTDYSGKAWIYGWTLAETDYIYFSTSTCQLVILTSASDDPFSSSSTTTNAALTALLKAESWTAPCTATYTTDNGTSSETLTCVSPGYYLVNIPAGTSSITFADSNSNTATASYPTTSNNEFVYDVSSSAWDTEAYQAYDSDGNETTSSDSEAYGLYYKYDTTWEYATITGLNYTDTDNGLALSLPSNIASGTYSVTLLGEAAFSADSNWNSGHTFTGKLTSVTFPTSITYIGAGAFIYRTDLTTVTLAEGLTGIGQGAFNCCGSLTGMTFPSTFSSFDASSTWDNTFEWCTSMTWVDLSKCSELVNLGNATFADCTWLANVYLPVTLDEIGSGVFTRTYTTNGEATLNLQYAITPAKELTTFASCLSGYYADFSSVSGLTAYYAESKSDDGTAIVMQPFTGTAAQGKGLVLKATAGTYYQIPLTTTEGTTVSSDNMMVGNTSSTFTVTDGMYFLSDGQFLQAASDGTLAKGKAYLDLSSSSSAKSLAISFADPTGISAASTTNNAADVWYNIAGERVLQPTHGLYIHNGKKVIVK